ncbi:TPA: hypothetical protein HA317_04920 [Candidatus Woesearchaeota archaeon]|nr:hypothetical protein [Candidatus Woesearchaeota archaeon]
MKKSKKMSKKRVKALRRKKQAIRKRNTLILHIVILALVAIAALYISSNYRLVAKEKNDKDNTPVSTEKVEFEMYVMSQCPYGVQAENGAIPALKKFGNAVDLKLYFIGQESGGQFSSLHGQPEVEEDMRQACIYEKFNDKLIPYLECINPKIANAGSEWQACAEQAGVDVDALKSCTGGEEGKNLLAASFQASTSKGVSGSPTIYVNMKPYSGARDELSFTRGICDAFSEKPAACNEIPECASDADCTDAEEGEIGKCLNPGEDNAECEYVDDARVELTVVNLASCKSCDASGLLDVLSNLFPNMDVKEVEADSEEGKALINKFGLVYAPSFIFSRGVTETNTWKTNERIQSAFEEAGDGYKLADRATGADYPISEEARQRMYDAIGVVKGDNKPQIDFFVMSYCPYGNQAEEAIEPVYQALGDSAQFNPRYVIYENYGGEDYCIEDGKYCSMHGIQELNQDVRELCVNKYYGIGKYFEFVLLANKECDYNNVDTCWEAQAEKIDGIDKERIKECQSSEAVELLEKEMELDQLLGVSGSPTVFIEGEAYSGSRQPADFQKALCDAFDSDKPDGCSVALESTEDVASGQC